jgi:hypothetical protein
VENITVGKTILSTLPSSSFIIPGPVSVSHVSIVHFL